MSAEHSVQLFDSEGSLAAAVARFIQEGLADGDSVLIVTSAERWDAIDTQLADDGVSSLRHVKAKRLMFLDARDLLRQVMYHGGPAPELFEASVARVVRVLAASARGLRIYADMVDLLARDGDYASAQRLEGLWNALASRTPFELFCGYSAANFGNPRDAESLRQICRCHSELRSDPDDILGSFLLDASGAAQRAHMRHAGGPSAGGF